MGKSKSNKTKHCNISSFTSSTSTETDSGGSKSSKYHKDEIFFDQQDILIASLCFVITLVAYMKTIHPSLPGGDSGELITAAHEFGVGHPPGYPLFTLLARLSLLAAPPAALRVNTLSALCGALAAAAVCLATRRLCASLSVAPQTGGGSDGAPQTRGGCGGAVLAGLMFPLSRLAWSWALCAEVFSLNSLLLAALLVTAAVFDCCPRHQLAQTSCVGALLCGLCLSNQHTSVLYILVLVPWVLHTLYTRQVLSVRVCVRVCVWFIAGLLPYVYLPLSCLRHTARWTWGDQSSLGGMMTHLLRQEYGTLDLLKDHTGQGFISGLWAYMIHAWNDLTPIVCCLFAASLIKTIYRLVHRSSGGLEGLCHLMLAVYLGFFCWRANLDIHNPLFFKVVERFWIQSDLVVCILAAVSFEDLMRMLQRYTKISADNMGLPAAAILIGFQMGQTWQACDQSANRVVQDFAVQTLQGFPRGALVLTHGDLPGNSLRYFHLCEGLRPDLIVFDQEILSYSWSVPMLGPTHPRLVIPGQRWQPYSGGMPGGGTAFTFKDLIDANYASRDIFACIGVQKHESSWTQSYVLFPYGVCQKIVDKRTALSVDDWARQTEGLTRDWNYTALEGEPGSWERVASEEMWRARTATGLFFLEQALAASDISVKTDLLLAAYKVYSSALARHPSPHIPPYWHRNFAIVCDHLAHSPSPLVTPPSTLVQTPPPPPDTAPLSHLGLVRSSRDHFQLYVDKEISFDSQEDVDRIKDAIQKLNSYLDNYDMGDLKS